MEIINRIKSILVSPKSEWQTIGVENAPHIKVFTTYVVPLALIPAIAAFVGYGLVGYSVLGHHVSNIGWGLRQAIVQYAAMLGGTYITAFVYRRAGREFRDKEGLRPRLFARGIRLYTDVCRRRILSFALALVAGFIGRIVWLVLALHWSATHDESPCRQTDFLFRCQFDSNDSRVGSPFIRACSHIVAGRILRDLIN